MPKSSQLARERAKLDALSAELTSLKLSYNQLVDNLKDHHRLLQKVKEYELKEIISKKDLDLLKINILMNKETFLKDLENERNIWKSEIKRLTKRKSRLILTAKAKANQRKNHVLKLYIKQKSSNTASVDVSCQCDLKITPNISKYEDTVGFQNLSSSTLVPETLSKPSSNYSTWETASLWEKTNKTSMLRNITYIDIAAVQHNWNQMARNETLLDFAFGFPPRAPTIQPNHSNFGSDLFRQHAPANLQSATPTKTNPVFWKNKVVDKYTLDALPFTRGGFCEVYHALEKTTSKKVVIKKIHPQYKNDAMVEINVLRSLSHPNIIETHDFISELDGHYIVFPVWGKLWIYDDDNPDPFAEAQSGYTLKDYLLSLPTMELDEGTSQLTFKYRLKFLEIFKIFSQLVNAADYLNILINSTLEIKIIDFGLSKTYLDNVPQGYGVFGSNIAPEMHNSAIKINDSNGEKEYWAMLPAQIWY
ncbi:hypothetical protein HDV02_002854 [Globomyces sp. JEL0801]|nr:hypothetical protein HDV02_002854 [Globomyces sp. JEL0801]